VAAAPLVHQPLPPFFPAASPSTNCEHLEYNCSGEQMKVARIAAPFGLSAVLFILAYLSSKDTSSGYFPVMLMGIGIVLAIIGIAAVFSNK